MKNKKEPHPLIKGAKDINNTVKTGKKLAYIVAGLIIVALFIGLIIGVFSNITGAIIIAILLIIGIIKNKLYK